MFGIALVRFTKGQFHCHIILVKESALDQNPKSFGGDRNGQGCICLDPSTEVTWFLLLVSAAAFPRKWHTWGFPHPQTQHNLPTKQKSFTMCYLVKSEIEFWLVIKKKNCSLRSRMQVSARLHTSLWLTRNLNCSSPPWKVTPKKNKVCSHR